jgi:hypothetical protein
MSYCFCRAKVSGPRKEVCDGCIVANKQIVGCNQGLLPCGGQTIIDLNEINGNASDVVYSLIPGGYSTDDFSAVSLSADGKLNITTGSAYTAHGLHEIAYQVTRGKNKDHNVVQICFDNPCDDECAKCNTCSGECYGTPEVGEIDMDCSETGATFDAAADLNMSSCDGTSTWSLTKVPDELAVIINSSGVITIDTTSAAVPDETYEIEWQVSCSKYGMTQKGTVEVTINNKCVEVECDSDEVCDKCTGNCVEVTSDMEVNKNGFGSQSGGGLSIS